MLYLYASSTVIWLVVSQHWQPTLTVPSSAHSWIPTDTLCSRTAPSAMPPHPQRMALSWPLAKGKLPQLLSLYVRAQVSLLSTRRHWQTTSLEQKTEAKCCIHWSSLSYWGSMMSTSVWEEEEPQVQFFYTLVSWVWLFWPLTSGQSGAIRLGISKALLGFSGNHGDILEGNGLLVRDHRMVERKKPGQKKARKKFAWWVRPHMPLVSLDACSRALLSINFPLLHTPTHRVKRWTCIQVK